MSLSIPNKFAANEYTSASKMNANFDAIAAEVNTLGDSVTSAVASVTALTNTVATLTTTVAKHGSYGFTAYSTGATTFSATTAATIVLAGEYLDAGSAFASNTFTPGASGTGTYLFSANAYVTLPDSGTVTLMITKNPSGSPVNYTVGTVVHGSGASESVGGTIIITAAATDTFVIQAQKSVALSGTVTVNSATFCGVRLLP